MARSLSAGMASILVVALSMLGYVHGEPHEDWQVEKRQSSNSIPLVVTNNCADTVYPGVLTQNGGGPSSSGFRLDPGQNRSLTVSQNWQGRVWGRTNCTFDSSGKGSSNGRTCSTGDCGPVVACTGTGENPATLAEFNMLGANDLAYYDLSLVDGYNLPMAIVLLPNSQGNVANIPPNETNPSCVATPGNMAAAGFNPYSSGSGTFLGTNSSFQLPFTTTSASDAANWCPWDLQVNPPQAPGNGVYPYPDGNVQRPAFSPCYSACAKYNEPAYCCTGKYEGAGKCSPNYYSKAAKAICPDAYSYAFDDQDSTFGVPSGAGFQVIMCPGGLSTNILATGK